MTRVVLITGASGFVGKHILRVLGDSDVTVRLVVREGSDISPDHSTKIDRVIRTPDLFAEPVSWWAGVCDEVDTIIHVAWYAEPGQYLQSSKNMDCLMGTLNLAQGAVQAGVRRFVGIGTCFEYDLTSGLLSIETPLKPLSPYAGSKAAAFLALSQYFPAECVEFVWCRLFYLYGDGEDARRLVPYVRARLSAGEFADLTNGIQIRDFLDVQDVGSMVVKAAMGDIQGAVNICSGVPITVRELVEQVADEYGRRDLLRFGARPENLVDPLSVVGVNTELKN